MYDTHVGHMYTQLGYTIHIYDTCVGHMYTHLGYTIHIYDTCVGHMYTHLGYTIHMYDTHFACCSVLQCVAVCSIVLQWRTTHLSSAYNNGTHITYMTHIQVNNYGAHLGYAIHLYDTHLGQVYVYKDLKPVGGHDHVPRCNTLQHTATHCNTLHTWNQ